MRRSCTAFRDMMCGVAVEVLSLSALYMHMVAVRGCRWGPDTCMCCLFMPGPVESGTAALMCSQRIFFHNNRAPRCV
jgi:hypothetical protein